MSDEERGRLKGTEAMIGGIINTMAIVPLEDAVALQLAMEREDGFMPLYDPTGWMRQRETMRVARDLMSAFMVFRYAIDTAKRDERARSEIQRLKGARP